MNLYAAIRPLLFRLEPELAHRVSLSLLPYLPLPQNLVGMTQPVSCMGLTFKNPVMLAAGLDKNADHVEALLGYPVCTKIEPCTLIEPATSLKSL